MEDKTKVVLQTFPKGLGPSGLAFHVIHPIKHDSLLPSSTFKHTSIDFLEFVLLPVCASASSSIKWDNNTHIPHRTVVNKNEIHESTQNEQCWAPGNMLLISAIIVIFEVTLLRQNFGLLYILSFASWASLWSRSI